MAALFHAEHQRLFGHANQAASISIDNLRVRTIGRQPKPSTAQLATRLDISAPTPDELRCIRLGKRWMEDVPVYAWSLLPPGWSSPGPAVIQQDLATILVPDGYLAKVGYLGDLEMTRG